MARTLRVGTLLYGFCGGYFGRDSYENKRVEAMGDDWVVARDSDGHIHFVCSRKDEDILKTLEEYTEPPKEWEGGENPST